MLAVAEHVRKERTHPVALVRHSSSRLTEIASLFAHIQRWRAGAVIVFCNLHTRERESFAVRVVVAVAVCTACSSFDDVIHYLNLKH